MNQTEINSMRTLFHLFVRTHSPKRAMILISINLKIPVEDIENELKKEILDSTPVRRI